MVRYCSVYGCLRNSSDNPKLKLFRFPADESRCREWARIIGRTDLYNKNIEDADTELVASWIDIKQLYEIEKDKQYKLAPKLTESHVDPSDSEKKCLKYATQALSRSVAAAIYTLVETGKLPESSFGTTKFVELFNDTFDILNSATVEDDYKYKRALCQADFQTEKLEEAYKIFSGLQVINPFNGEDMTHSMRFIEGFLISINAILSLSSALKIADFSALFTRRLNLEALENFCGDIRQQGGVSRVASPIKFHIAFKKLFVSSLITPVENTDCSKNLDQILTDIEEAETSLALTENETKRNNKKCSKNKKAKATPVTKLTIEKLCKKSLVCHCAPCRKCLADLSKDALPTPLNYLIGYHARRDHHNIIAKITLTIDHKVCQA
ncbi:hypothetical protein NE865_04740 [Phthorimaea operculella]|nr:hypothetical protein NE865_04740 [Phthorimaea operculella]